MNMKQLYRDCFNAMSGDKKAGARLITVGLIPVDYKIIDLYLASKKLAEIVGPAVVASEARQAEKELDTLTTK